MDFEHNTNISGRTHTIKDLRCIGGKSGQDRDKSGGCHNGNSSNKEQ